MNKRIVVYIGAKGGSDEQRLALRDRVVATIQEAGGKIVNQTPGLPTFQAEMTDDLKKNLQKKFPQATIEDEIKHTITPPPFKP